MCTHIYTSMLMFQPLCFSIVGFAIICFYFTKTPTQLVLICACVDGAIDNHLHIFILDKSLVRMYLNIVYVDTSCNQHNINDTHIHLQHHSSTHTHKTIEKKLKDEGPSSRPPPPPPDTKKKSFKEGCTLS